MIMIGWDSDDAQVALDALELFIVENAHDRPNRADHARLVAADLRLHMAVNVKVAPEVDRIPPALPRVGSAEPLGFLDAAAAHLRRRHGLDPCGNRDDAA